MLDFLKTEREVIEEQEQRQRNLSEMGDVHRGLRSGWNQLQALGGGAIGLLGDAFGSESVAKKGYDYYQEQMEEASMYPGSTERIEDIRGFGDAVDWLQYNVAGQVPNLLSMAISGGIGSAIGKKVVGTAVKEAVKQQVAKGVTREIAEKVAFNQLKRAAGLGAKTGVIASASAMEGGNMWGQDVEKHGLEGTSPVQDALFGIASGASEIYGPAGRLAAGMTKPVKGGLVKRALKGFGEEAVQEGVIQGGLQDINEVLQDPETDIFTKERILNHLNEAAVGGVVGGITGPITSRGALDVDEDIVEAATAANNSAAILDEEITRAAEHDAVLKKIEAENQAIQSQINELYDYMDTPENIAIATEPVTNAMEGASRLYTQARNTTGQREKTQGQFDRETEKILFEKLYNEQETPLPPQLDDITERRENLESLRRNSTRPITEQNSILANQLPGERTKRQVETDARAERQEDLEYAFKDKVIPDAYSTLEKRLNEGEPDWFKNNETLKKAGKVGVKRVINKARNGQELTARQDGIKYELDRVVENPEIIGIKKSEKSTPEKLADAIGKPNVVENAALQKTTEEQQIKNIVDDTVRQPEDIARLARKKGNYNLADKYHQKAVENGNKLKAADGELTEKAVSAVFNNSAEEDYKEFQKSKITPPKKEKKTIEPATGIHVRINGAGPQTFDVVRKEPPNKQDLEGEKYYTVRNVKTGEEQIVERNDFTPLKKHTVKFDEFEAKIENVPTFKQESVEKTTKTAPKIDEEPLSTEEITNKESLAHGQKVKFSKRTDSDTIEDPNLALNELNAKIGKDNFKSLTDGPVKVIRSDEVEDITGAPDDSKQAEGFTTENGTVYLVADNLGTGRAYPVLIHELGVHSKRLGFKKTESFKKVLRLLEARAKLDNKEGQLIRNAIDKVPLDTDPETHSEEVLAYLVEEHPETSTVRRLIAAIKKFLIETVGIKDISWLNNADLRALAEGAVKKRSQIQKSSKPQEKKKQATQIKDNITNVVDRVLGSERARSLTHFWLDRHHPVKVVQDYIKERYGDLPEDFDYLMAERLRGKKATAEVEQFDREEVEPLLDEITKKKKTISGLEEYAYAKHTPERNLQMRRINALDYLKNILRNKTGKESEELTYKIATARSEFDVNDKRDAYLDLLAEEFSKIPQIEDDVAAMQDAFDNVDFSDDTTGSKLRWHKSRLDNAKKRLDRIKRLQDRWEKVSDKFSGQTDEQAQSVLDEIEEAGETADYEELRVMLSAINDKKLDTLLEAGEITQEAYDAIKNTYEFYVPLYREGFDEPGMPVGASTLGPLGSPIKSAVGSDKAVVDIFANTISNRQRAIQIKHKAEAKRVLYDLVQETSDSGLWLIEDTPKKKGHDAEGNVTEYVDFQEPKDGVFVNIDGERKLIRFNRSDPELMRMLQTIKQEDNVTGPLISTLGKFTRVLASLNTSWNPEFLMTNFTRDLGTAGVNLQDTEAAGMQKKIVKKVLPMIRDIFKAEQGDFDTTYGGVYKDFMAHGGKIGWMQSYETISDLAKDLKGRLADKEGKHVIKTNFKKFAETFKSANTAVENAVRLATYNELVKSDLVTKDKAALIASNLTVDFTRHGTVGPNINALYMFFNAGVQGNYRLIKGAARSKSIRRILGGITAAGFGAHFLALATGGDDDETGMPKYYQDVSNNLKNRNIIFMLPDGSPIKIASPYGYSLFWSIGDEMARAVYSKMSGLKYSPEKGAVRIAQAFGDSFNPLSSGSILQTIMPTVGDPFAMAYENKNWFGGKLMPDQNPFAEKPDSRRYFRNVRTVNKTIAAKINDWTGGSETRSGYIDVSPETLDMVVDTMTGGAGKFASDVLNLPARVLHDEIKLKDVPFARKIFSGKSEHGISSHYYDIKKEVKLLEREYKAAKNRKERDKIRNKQYFNLIPLVKNTEKRLRKLYKYKGQLEDELKNTDNVDKRINTLKKKVIAQST